MLHLIGREVRVLVFVPDFHPAEVTYRLNGPDPPIHHHGFHPWPRAHPVYNRLEG